MLSCVQYGGMVSQLADRAKSVVRDLDPTNSLTFLRVKSAKHEVSSSKHEVSSAKHEVSSAKHEVSSSKHKFCSAKHKFCYAKHEFCSAKHEVTSAKHEDRAKSVVRDLDPTNSLTFLRVKSAKHEVKLISNLISALR